MQRSGRVWILWRVSLALACIPLLLPSSPGTADEIGLSLEPSAAPVTPALTTGITCLSNAQISFFPVSPQAERVVRIDVLAPAPSTEVTLLSSLRLYFESDAQEPTGYRWSWFTWSEFPGDFEITFLDAMRSECATARLVVGASSSASDPVAPPSDPVAPGAATATPRPTRTPRVASVTRSSSSDDDDDDDDDDSPTPRKATATRTPSPTRTPTPTRTPEPEDAPRPTRTPMPTATEVPKPVIASTDPSSVMCGAKLTIKGRGFGSNRSAVSGRVELAGKSVAAYDQWSDSEIEVIISTTSPTGPGETLIVETRGGADSEEIKVSC